MEAKLTSTARRRKELEHIKAFFEDYIAQSATPKDVRKNIRNRIDDKIEHGNIYLWMKSVQAVCWKPEWGDIAQWWELNTISSTSPVRVQTTLSVATQNSPAERQHNRPLSPGGDILEVLYQFCTGAEKKKSFVVSMLQKANDWIGQEQERVAKDLMAWRTTQVNDWAMSISPVANGRSQQSHSPRSPSLPASIDPLVESDFQALGVEKEKDTIMTEAKGNNNSSSTRGKDALFINVSSRDMPDSSTTRQFGGIESFSSSKSNSVEWRNGGEGRNDVVRDLEDCQTSKRQMKNEKFLE